MNTRMDRSRFQIGAYCLAPYARTERHIREISECGIDFMIGVPNDRAVLDHFAKYGVGAVVNGVVPGWFGGKGENAGTMEKERPFSLYEAAAQKFEDHPAIWAIDIGDEPSSVDFPHYGKVYERVEQLFPKQFAYLNLYPGYGMLASNTPEEIVAQLGTDTYREYLERYCENFTADYLCHDYYLYSASAKAAYENFEAVSEICRRTGKRMWTVLQVNSHTPDRQISENQLRFQAYLAMAFGTQLISWACYTAGWWHHQVLDGNGEKTEQYEKLQKVNAELHHIGETYMQYRNVSTRLIGTADCWDGLPSVPSADLGLFREMRAEGGCIVVGEMVSRKGEGSCALLLCGADDPTDTCPKEYAVRFRVDAPCVRVIDETGERTLFPQEDGSYCLQFGSSRGLLLTTK